VSISVEVNDKGYSFAKYINAASTFSAFQPPPPDTKAAFFAQMKARAQGQQMGQRATGATPVHGQQRAPQGQPSQGQQPRTVAQQMSERTQQSQQHRSAAPVQQTQQRAQQPPRGPQMQPQQPAGFVDEDIPF